jgi:uncharacterized protein YjdB
MRRLSHVLVVALIASACSSASTTAPSATSTFTFTPAITFSGTEFFVPGQASQLTATELLSSGTTQDVTNTAAWASSDPRVAIVSRTGLVTAVAIGAATITATDSATVGTWVVAVSTATVTSLLVVGPGSLGSAQFSQMSAVASLRGGLTQTVTNDAAWQSSNPGVATVSSSGLLTTVKPGTTTITATYMGTAGTWVVTVNDTVTSILLFGAGTLTSSTVQTSQFIAAATMSTGPEQIVTNAAAWTSSNPAVATVSGTGLVTAVAAGVTDITATYNGLAGTVTIVVN